MICNHCDKNLIEDGVEFRMIFYGDGKERIVMSCKHCGFPIKSLTDEEQVALSNLVARIMKRKHPFLK